MTSQTVANLLEPPDKPSNRPVHYRISEHVKRGCDALVSGAAKNVTEAAALAGITRENFSRALRKEHVIQYLRGKACRTLAIAAGRAAAVKVELLDSDSDHVRNEVSEYVLALAGIKPAADPNLSVSLNIKAAGYIIDLGPDGPRDQQRGPLIDAVPSHE